MVGPVNAGGFEAMLIMGLSIPSTRNRNGTAPIVGSRLE
jgi:hypothetical protein